MRVILIFLTCFSLIFSLQATETVTGCFPKNSLRFEKNLKSNNAITEEEFKEILNKVQTVMEPEIKKYLNKRLIILNKWDDPAVDAHATRDDENNAVISIFGGLARHPSMTKDGLLLVLCHEVGHHIGGAPKIPRGNTNLRGWSSAEGQADYYATSKCLPKIFTDDIVVNKNFEEVDPNDYKSALSKCKDEICTRNVLAGLSISRLFASLKMGSKVPDILKNDTQVVSKTIYTHPNPQCRLDTYLSGAICDVSFNSPFDNVDPRIGACLNPDKGGRPLCWYNQDDFVSK